MKTKLKRYRTQNDYCIVLDPRDFGTEAEIMARFGRFPVSDRDCTDEQWSDIAVLRELSFVRRQVGNLELTLDQLETGAKCGNRHCAAVLGTAILCLYSRRQVVADGLSWLARAANEGVRGAFGSLFKWYSERYLDSDLWDYENVDLGLDSCYVPTKQSPLIPFPASERECQERALFWGLRGIIAGNTLCAERIGHFPVAVEDLAAHDDLLDRAAATGCTEARFLAAQYHSRPGASSRERRKATAEFRELAENGIAGAALMLANAIEQDPTSCPDATPADAVRWYRMAAESGSPIAMRQLAARLEEGKAVPKDESAAAEWIRRAAEAGDAIARLQHGGNLLARKGASNKDQREGVRWIRLAAEEDNLPEAWAMMAYVYGTGLGSYRNPNKSARCLKRAQALGLEIPPDLTENIECFGTLLSAIEAAKKR